MSERQRWLDHEGILHGAAFFGSQAAYESAMRGEHDDGQVTDGRPELRSKRGGILNSKHFFADAMDDLESLMHELYDAGYSETAAEVQQLVERLRAIHESRRAL